MARAAYVLATVSGVIFIGAVSAHAQRTMVAAPTRDVAVYDRRDPSSEDVVVRDVRLNGDTISGTLVNRTGRMIRDTDLAVGYTWMWKNERHPGNDNPGRTVITTVNQEIPPRGERSFTFRPPFTLPMRNDGHFEPSVHVLGFTELRTVQRTGDQPYYPGDAPYDRGYAPSQPSGNAPYYPGGNAPSHPGGAPYYPGSSAPSYSR